VASEILWGKDWKGSAGVKWASGPEKGTGNDEHCHKGRGMAVMFSTRLGEIEPKIEAKDPSGRFIIVSCTIYGARTMIVAYHADNKISLNPKRTADEMQEAFYSRLRQAIPIRPDYQYILMGDANNVLDWDTDYRTASGTVRHAQDHPLGTAALRNLQHHIAWRTTRFISFTLSGSA